MTKSVRRLGVTGLVVGLLITGAVSAAAQGLQPRRILGSRLARPAQTSSQTADAEKDREAGKARAAQRSQFTAGSLTAEFERERDTLFMDIVREAEICQTNLAEYATYPYWPDAMGIVSNFCSKEGCVVVDVGHHFGSWRQSSWWQGSGKNAYVVSCNMKSQTRFVPLEGRGGETDGFCVISRGGSYTNVACRYVGSICCYDSDGRFVEMYDSLDKIPGMKQCFDDELKVNYAEQDRWMKAHGFSNEGSGRDAELKLDAARTNMIARLEALRTILSKFPQWKAGNRWYSVCDVRADLRNPATGGFLRPRISGYRPSARGINTNDTVFVKMSERFENLGHSQDQLIAEFVRALTGLEFGSSTDTNGVLDLKFNLGSYETCTFGCGSGTGGVNRVTLIAEFEPDSEQNTIHEKLDMSLSTLLSAIGMNRDALAYNESANGGRPLQGGLRRPGGNQDWKIVQSFSQRFLISRSRQQSGEYVVTISDQKKAAVQTANDNARRPAGLLGGSLRARRLQRQQEAQAAAEKQQTELTAQEKAQREVEREEQRQQLLAIKEEFKRLCAAKAAAAVDNIKGAVTTWMLDNKKSTPPSTLSVLVKADGDKKPQLDGGEKALVDPWGQSYMIQIKGKWFAIVSAGPDTKFHTADDIRTDNGGDKEQGAGRLVRTSEIKAPAAKNQGLAASTNCVTKKSVPGKISVAEKLQSCDFLLNKDFKKNAKMYLCLFSASWCGPCRAEMPRIAKTYAETLKNDPDIELIHFSRDQNDEKAMAWAKGHDVKFPVVKPRGGNPLDLHCNGIPHLFIVKHDGTLVEEGHPMNIFNEEKFREIKGASTTGAREPDADTCDVVSSDDMTGPYGIRMQPDPGCEKGALYVLKRLKDVYLPAAVRYYGDPFVGQKPTRVFTLHVKRNDGTGDRKYTGVSWGSCGDGIDSFTIGLAKGSDKWEMDLPLVASKVLTVCSESDSAAFSIYANDFVRGEVGHYDPISKIKEDIREGLRLRNEAEGNVKGRPWVLRKLAPTWAAFEELREKHPTLVLDYCNLKNSKYAKGELPQKISADQMEALMGEVTGVDAVAIFKKHSAAGVSSTPQGKIAVAEKLGQCDFLLNKDFKKNAKFYLCLFSASWCGPCRAEMPRIAKTYAETLKDDPDIELIHFSRDQNDEKAMAWAKEHDVKFPVVKPKGGNPLDLHCNGIPHLFIIKANGVLQEEGHPMRLFTEEKLRELKK